MRRIILRTIALAISLIILSMSCSGCVILSSLFGISDFNVKFGDMEYSRPDMDGIYDRLDRVVEIVSTNKISYASQLKEVQKFVSSDYSEILTMYTLSFVKYVITPDSDSLYEEFYYMSEVGAELSVKLEKLYVACAQSKYRENFEKDYFGEGELEQYVNGEKNTEESAALLTKEAQLVAEYKNLCTDDSATQEMYSGLYAELVRTRLLLAEELGYESYADYAFETLGRDYTLSDISKYIDGVITYLVPIYCDRTNSGLMWTGENRSFSSDSLRAAISEITANMGSYTKKPYQFMDSCDLLYVSANEFAITESFTTYFPDYYSPFIYIASECSLNDVITLLHEFGHFTDSYYNYGQDSNLDQCEIASQAMELLALNYLDDCQVLSESDVSYIKSYMYDSLLATFIQQSLFTRFEEKVYSLDYDSVTVENISKAASDVLAEFGLTEIIPTFSTEWYGITHFFNQAFYVTSYITSGDVALQIYALATEDADEGLKKYKELLQWDYDMDFIENTERAELRSPFSDGRVPEISTIIAESFN